MRVLVRAARAAVSGEKDGEVLRGEGVSAPVTSLAIFTKASQMLAEADTIQKAKELKTLALTASEWAKRKGMGEEAILYCRSYALEAERKMGEMLRAAEKNAGAKGIGKSAVPTGNRTPTLAELGLSKRESAEAQMLAALPADDFEDLKAGKKSKTEVRRERSRAEVMGERKLPSDKFRVLYADPPWKYGDGLPQTYGGVKFHYPSMAISELCALPIGELAHDDAVLFLWVTSPLLFECVPVVKAWGFAYKTSFVWDKVKHNMGRYNSVRHEFLLVATRGSCLPEVNKLFDSVQSIERGEHSEKPEAFREIIDTLYPSGKRLELFARKEVAGWERWGNQVL